MVLESIYLGLGPFICKLYMDICGNIPNFNSTFQGYIHFWVVSLSCQRLNWPHVLPRRLWNVYTNVQDIIREINSCDSYQYIWDLCLIWMLLLFLG